jgi:diacylglycerol kinase (ATP)
VDTLLLTSPGAGSADDESLAAAVAVLTEDGAVEVTETSSRESLDAALDRLADRRLVLAGGDGSLHQLVKRLWRRGELANVPIGLLPMGTGNDFARYLDLPLDPAAAARTVLSGRARWFDLIRSDGGGGVVVNAVHLGMGAEAAERAGAYKGRLGKLAYPLGAVASLFGPRGWRLHVNVDDTVLADGSHKLLMVAIGNGSSIGGGAALFPRADAGDGKLDVLVLGPVGSAGAGTGGQPFRLVRRARGRAVSVTPGKGVEVGVNVDGDVGTLRGRRSWWVEQAAWSVYGAAPEPSERAE